MPTKVTKSLITSVDVSQINTTGSDAGKVLTSNGSTLNWVASSSIGSTGITQGTAVSLAGNQGVNFTGIPSTAKRITVMVSGMSCNGTAVAIFRVGSSGTIVTAGYSSQAWSDVGGGVITTGLPFTKSLDSTGITTGKYVLDRMTDNIWVGMGLSAYLTITSDGAQSAGTTPNLAGPLDIIRFTTLAGTATFDAGTINISWE